METTFIFCCMLVTIGARNVLRNQDSVNALDSGRRYMDDVVVPHQVVGLQHPHDHSHKELVHQQHVTSTHQQPHKNPLRSHVSSLEHVLRANDGDILDMEVFKPRRSYVIPCPTGHIRVGTRCVKIDKNPLRSDDTLLEHVLRRSDRERMSSWDDLGSRRSTILPCPEGDVQIGTVCLKPGNIKPLRSDGTSLERLLNSSDGENDSDVDDFKRRRSYVTPCIPGHILIDDYCVRPEDIIPLRSHGTSNNSKTKHIPSCPPGHVWVGSHCLKVKKLVQN